MASVVLDSVPSATDETQQNDTKPKVTITHQDDRGIVSTLFDGAVSYTTVAESTLINNLTLGLTIATVLAWMEALHELMVKYAPNVIEKGKLMVAVVLSLILALLAFLNKPKKE